MRGSLLALLPTYNRIARLIVQVSMKIPKFSCKPLLIRFPRGDDVVKGCAGIGLSVFKPPLSPVLLIAESMPEGLIGNKNVTDDTFLIR
jgi:hypothetical protein